MKILGLALWFLAFILSTIVSYHVMQAAAPQYAMMWTVSVVVLVISMVCMVAGELEK